MRFIETLPTEVKHIMEDTISEESRTYSIHRNLDTVYKLTEDNKISLRKLN